MPRKSPQKYKVARSFGQKGIFGIFIKSMSRRGIGIRDPYRDDQYAISERFGLYRSNEIKRKK